MSATDYNAIITRYDGFVQRATDEQRREAVHWYPNARLQADTVGRITGSATPQLTGAGLIAALSPRMRWSQNIDIATTTARGETPKGVLGASIARARKFLTDGPSVFVSPKIWSFYQNLAGNESPVTIDSWMLRAGGHPRDSATVRQYNLYADAVREVAKHRQLLPTVAQALIWFVIRSEMQRRVRS